MFEVQKNWNPIMFGVEEEKIKKAIGPFLNREMVKRNLYINLPDPPLVPSKDKMQRARSIQARMRAGGVRFDTEAAWFPALMEQMLRFPRGAHDDYVDMLSWAGLLMDRMHEAPTESEIEDDEYERGIEYVGRSALCGY
jgi:predicted phage terminase large subunit-like protein